MATMETAPKFATKAIRPRVLVVDDEPDLLKLMRDIVGREMDCRILAAKTVAEAQAILKRETVELLLADVNLPDGDGTTLLPTLREQQPTAEAIVITGRPTVGNAIDALRAGAVDFLPKPFNASTLIERVQNALDR